MASKSYSQLKSELAEANDFIVELEARLDKIGGIVAGEADEDEDEDDDEDGPADA